MSNDIPWCYVTCLRLTTFSLPFSLIECLPFRLLLRTRCGKSWSLQSTRSQGTPSPTLCSVTPSLPAEQVPRQCCQNPTQSLCTSMARLGMSCLLLRRAKILRMNALMVNLKVWRRENWENICNTCDKIASNEILIAWRTPSLVPHV